MRGTARYTLDRLQDKCTNCKGVKDNTNFRQIAGIKEKLHTTCKYLFLSFRRVLNAICSFLGNSPASEF